MKVAEDGEARKSLRFGPNQAKLILQKVNYLYLKNKSIKKIGPLYSKILFITL